MVLGHFDEYNKIHDLILEVPYASVPIGLVFSDENSIWRCIFIIHASSDPVKFVVTQGNYHYMACETIKPLKP